MGEPGVGRMRDRLLLYSGIYRNPFEIFGVDRPGAVGHRQALLQQRDDLLLTQPLAPTRERRAIKWQLVPEHHCRLLAQVKSSRSINPFLILHGRLIIFGTSPARSAHPQTWSHSSRPLGFYFGIYGPPRVRSCG